MVIALHAVVVLHSVSPSSESSQPYNGRFRVVSLLPFREGRCVQQSFNVQQ